MATDELKRNASSMISNNQPGYCIVIKNIGHGLSQDDVLNTLKSTLPRGVHRHLEDMSYAPCDDASNEARFYLPLKRDAEIALKGLRSNFRDLHFELESPTSDDGKDETDGETGSSVVIRNLPRNIERQDLRQRLEKFLENSDEDGVKTIIYPCRYLENAALVELSNNEAAVHLMQHLSKEDDRWKTQNLPRKPDEILTVEHGDLIPVLAAIGGLPTLLNVCDLKKPAKKKNENGTDFVEFIGTHYQINELRHRLLCYCKDISFSVRKSEANVNKEQENLKIEDQTTVESSIDQQTTSDVTTTTKTESSEQMEMNLGKMDIDETRTCGNPSPVLSERKAAHSEQSEYHALSEVNKIQAVMHEENQVNYSCYEGKEQDTILQSKLQSINVQPEPQVTKLSSGLSATFGGLSVSQSNKEVSGDAEHQFLDDISESESEVSDVDHSDDQNMPTGPKKCILEEFTSQIPKQSELNEITSEGVNLTENINNNESQDQETKESVAEPCAFEDNVPPQAPLPRKESEEFRPPHQCHISSDDEMVDEIVPERTRIGISSPPPSNPKVEIPDTYQSGSTNPCYAYEDLETLDDKAKDEHLEAESLGTPTTDPEPELYPSYDQEIYDGGIVHEVIEIERSNKSIESIYQAIENISHEYENVIATAALKIEVYAPPNLMKNVKRELSRQLMTPQTDDLNNKMSVPHQPATSKHEMSSAEPQTSLNYEIPVTEPVASLERHLYLEDSIPFDILPRISFQTDGDISVTLLCDSITRMDVDVLVSATNSQMKQWGSGVVGAIAKAAGPRLGNECRKHINQFGELAVGEVVITGAGDMQCQHILHALGPNWAEYSQKSQCSDILQETYSRCLETANAHTLRSIALPGISAGNFGVPKQVVAMSLYNAIRSYCEDEKCEFYTLKTIYIVDTDEQLVKCLRDIFLRDSSKLLFHRKYDFLTDVVTGSAATGENNTSTPLVAMENSNTIKPNSDNEQCPICLEFLLSPKTLPECKHTFCEACIDRCFKSRRSCPVCGKVYGEIRGNQPAGGCMTHRCDEWSSLPGYDGYGTIIIDYDIPGGVQTEEHPNPGKLYQGTHRTAYLPNNNEGRQVLKLLKKAFDARLTFTIGRSNVTGIDNMVTWNDIHHKTSTTGGPPAYGYPDPDYLKRVKEELTVRGIVDSD